MRVRDRYRLLAVVLGASLALQSAFVVILASRTRHRVRDALTECESVRLRTLDALAACKAAVVAVEQAPPPDASAHVDADAAPPAPSRHVRGTGSNGRFLYADIVTDYHDGEPPTVQRIYKRIPDALRSPRFRAGGEQPNAGSGAQSAPVSEGDGPSVENSGGTVEDGHQGLYDMSLDEGGIVRNSPPPLTPFRASARMLSRPVG